MKIIICGSLLSLSPQQTSELNDLSVSIVKLAEQALPLSFVLVLVMSIVAWDLKRSDKRQSEKEKNDDQ